MKLLNDLVSLEKASELIQDNRILIIAGEETLLNQLPAGNWIGGTIPYFMSENGGLLDKSKVFVNDLTDIIEDYSIQIYDETSIASMVKNNFPNGFSYMLIPGFSDMLSKYSLIAQEMPGIYDIPLMGWVTGIDLNDIGNKTPKIIDGKSLRQEGNMAAVLHAKLPENLLARMEIINIFKQGEGDEISFETEGFLQKECLVNGSKRNLAEYIEEKGLDTKLPLVADYSGAMINISFQQINKEDNTVLFYAPLRTNTIYKLAAPVTNYVEAFNEVIPADEKVVSSCNCILNYLYSELEGKKTGQMKGPFTFGEIAYILVNQTMVYLSILDV